MGDGRGVHSHMAVHCDLATYIGIVDLRVVLQEEDALANLAPPLNCDSFS